MWCIKRGKKSVEFVTSRRSTKERDQCVHSKSLMYEVFMCSSDDWCTRLVTNHDQRQNPVLTCEIRRRTHPWLKRPACPMVVGRNGGVRQHRVENAPDGCNCNPLGQQKWIQIVEGVVSFFCVQMVVQHRDSDPQAPASPGRRGGQTLGIP